MLARFSTERCQLSSRMPGKKIQVDNEMTVKPYESEADHALRAKADEERRKREEEAKGANDKYRALEVPPGKALWEEGF